MSYECVPPTGPLPGGAAGARAPSPVVWTPSPAPICIHALVILFQIHQWSESVGVTMPVMYDYNVASRCDYFAKPWRGFITSLRVAEFFRVSFFYPLPHCQILGSSLEISWLRAWSSQVSCDTFLGKYLVTGSDQIDTCNICLPNIISYHLSAILIIKQTVYI